VRNCKACRKIVESNDPVYNFSNVKSVVALSFPNEKYSTISSVDEEMKTWNKAKLKAFVESLGLSSKKMDKSTLAYVAKMAILVANDVMPFERFVGNPFVVFKNNL